MAVYLITFHVVAIICLVAALIAGIVAAVQGGMDHGQKDSYKAFLIIGIVGVAVATLIELLIKFVDSMRGSMATYILALIFVIIGGLGFLVASILITNANYIVMTVIACVFALQAILIYVIQWKFSA